MYLYDFTYIRELLLICGVNKLLVTKMATGFQGMTCPHEPMSFTLMLPIDTSFGNPCPFPLSPYVWMIHSNLKPHQHQKEVS